MKTKVTGGWKVPGPDNLNFLYHPSTDDFRIGCIGGGDISADQAREVVERMFGYVYGPILHMALAPHELDKGGMGHNVIETYSSILDRHTTRTADGLIMPKTASFMMGTFVGDCAVLAVNGPNYMGMIHAGRPELMESPSVISNFFGVWPDPVDETFVQLGASITGPHYEYDKAHNDDPARCITRWGTVGWDPVVAIYEQLTDAGIDTHDDDRFNNVSIDPFQMCSLGHTEWASARWWRHEHGTTLSPRNYAAVSYWHKDE